MVKNIIILISIVLLSACKSRIIVEPHIIYNRIDNYITINSPKSDSITVLGNNRIISPTKNDSYLIPFYGQKDNVKTIKIITYAKNKKVDTVNYKLEARFLKCYPNYKINGSKIDTVMDRNKLKNAVIRPYHENFIYNDTFEVTGFMIKIPGYKDIRVDGNRITDEVFDIIKKLDNGDYILIYSIDRYIENMSWIITPCSPKPIIIKITDNHSKRL